MSVNKVAFDSAVAGDSSVGLVTSGASGCIGLGLQSADRACSDKPVMNECKHLFDIMNDGDDDESFDIVTMFNECTPPLNDDVDVQQVTDVQFDMEKFIADSNVSMHYVTSFDCPQGYHQMPVREQDKWLTAFVCLGQLFEFNRTPFGMKTFVRAMQIIIKPLKDLRILMWMILQSTRILGAMTLCILKNF